MWKEGYPGKLTEELKNLMLDIEIAEDKLYICVEEPMPYVVREWIGGKERMVMDSSFNIFKVSCDHVSSYDEKCQKHYHKMIKSSLKDNSPYVCEKNDLLFSHYKSTSSCKEDSELRFLGYIHYKHSNVIDKNVIRFVSTSGLPNFSDTDIVFISECKNSMRIMKTLTKSLNFVYPFYNQFQISSSTDWLSVDDLDDLLTTLSEIFNMKRKKSCIIS